MCRLRSIESFLLRFSERNSHRVPVTAHIWNCSWTPPPSPTVHYSSLLHSVFIIYTLSPHPRPPSFFPTGLWAPLGALPVPSLPPPWRGGGRWSGAWAGASTRHRRCRSGTAGTSTKCRWWCATSWSPATSAWSCWPRPRWASPCCCSSITVRSPQPKHTPSSAPLCCTFKSL